MGPCVTGNVIRLVLIAFLLAANASAAVVQGVVLDDETGYVLARTTVSLVPLPGTQAGTATLRTGERGAFSILGVRPGWYVLRTSRRGFGDAEAGQVKPGRPGTPFEVTSDGPGPFLQVRMRRLAAVTGSVVDENGVGIADWPVSIYVRKPIRRLLEVKTDDRGDFRIGGLDPGTYVVRSSAGILEDESGLLPTWHKFGTALENAEVLRLRLGETRRDVVVHPVPGKLLRMTGTFYSPVPATLTLITDTGRRLVASTGGQLNLPFEAASVPPGPVEWVVEGNGCGSYNRMIVDKDAAGLRFACGPLYPPFIEWRGLDARYGLAYPILVRRVDLDGTGAGRALKSGEALPPGRWEFAVQLPPQMYMLGVSAQMAGEASTRNDGWFGLTLGNQARLTFTGSKRPAAISGTVATQGHPVAGATVYLEWFDQTSRERLQLWSVRCDSQGRFSAGGLAPGSYRMLASFDFDPDDPFAMERAQTLSVKEGETQSVSLELFLQ